MLYQGHFFCCQPPLRFNCYEKKALNNRDGSKVSCHWPLWPTARAETAREQLCVQISQASTWIAGNNAFNFPLLVYFPDTDFMPEVLAERPVSAFERKTKQSDILRRWFSSFPVMSWPLCLHLNIMWRLSLRGWREQEETKCIQIFVCHLSSVWTWPTVCVMKLDIISVFFKLQYYNWEVVI